MPKISREKRSRLLLVFLVTFSVAIGLYLSLIKAQREKLAAYPRMVGEAEGKLKNMRAAIKEADQTEAQLQAASEKLAEIETGMASGDLTAWLYGTIRGFMRNYKEVAWTFGSVEEGEVKLLPGFPYKQVSISISGSAHFYDFGRFLADLENTYPYFRVQGVTLEPPGGTASAPAEKEKLTVHFQIVALVKPG